MGGNQIVHIAILGLSLRSLHNLKEALMSVIPDDMYVHWTNITDPKLDWLLINEVFISSANIQRLLQNKKIKVLKLTKGKVLPEEELERFNFKEMGKLQLRHWSINNIYDMKVVNFVEEKKFQSLSEDLSHTDLDIKKLLSELTHSVNGRIKIFDRRGEIALCDLETQWVWTDHQARTTDQSLNYTHSTIVEILDQNAKQQHFKLWLWNLIWNSPELVVMPPENNYFKLKIWPQPKLEQGHREVLRLSAYFAKGGTIEDIAVYSKLPIGTVQHFVAASLAVGFLESIEKVQEPQVSSIEKVIAEEYSGLKSFFNGLRRRLGL